MTFKSDVTIYINPETRDHYVNRNWYLFETSHKKAYYSRFLQECGSRIKQITEHVKVDHRESISWFANLKGLLNSLMVTLNRGRMQYHFKLVKYPIYPLLGDLIKKLGIIEALYGELIEKTGFGHENIPIILKNPPDWNFPSPRHLELKYISLVRAGLVGDENVGFKNTTEFNEEWMASLHTQIDQLVNMFEDISKEWSNYCEKNLISL